MAKNLFIFIFFCTILTANGLENVCRLCVCRSNFTFNCSNQSLTYPHNIPSSATYLDFSLNNISSINETTFKSLQNLKFLNLSYNLITDLPDGLALNSSFIETIDLSGNYFDSIGAQVFEGLTNIQQLHLNNLSHLSFIHPDAFSYLINLKYLSISNNPNLVSLNGALSLLSSLSFLDVSGNSLKYISVNSANLLKTSNFSHNAWVCDCDMKDNLITTTYTTSALNFSSFYPTQKYFLCDSPPHFKHLPVLYTFNLLHCRIHNSSNSSIPSNNESINPHAINTLNDLEKKVLIIEYGQNVSLHPHTDFNKEECLWTREKDHYLSFKPRSVFIHNNSLIILQASRDILGDYFLFCYKMSNQTSRQVYSLVHRSSLMFFVEVYSIVVGLITAASFFILSLFYGSLRWCVVRCSKEEKATKVSMREVLTTMKNAKFQSYKDAQLEKLSAFRSATLEQLCAFRLAKVNKLRTYKQATVNSILHCLDQLRDHYTSKTNKIKSNCQSQFDRLKESYADQKSKFKDSKSQQVRRIRENYNQQADKIKDYSTLQLARLREQYKTQQQNLLRILELLELKNCLTDIREDCSRTESAIFDSDLTTPEIQILPFFNHPLPDNFPDVTGDDTDDDVDGMDELDMEGMFDPMDDEDSIDIQLDVDFEDDEKVKKKIEKSKKNYQKNEKKNKKSKKRLLDDEGGVVGKVVVVEVVGDKKKKKNKEKKENKKESKTKKENSTKT